MKVTKRINQLTPGTECFLQGLPVKAVFHGMKGSSAIVSITQNGKTKRTTWAAATLVEFESSWEAPAEIVPPAPKPERKKVWKAPKNRPSCRMFFQNLFSRVVDGVKQFSFCCFERAFELLQDQYPDLRAGHDRETAYKIWTARISEARRRLTSETTAAAAAA